jgi:hypothetical protein
MCRKLCQNHWASGLCPLSGTQNIRKTMIQKHPVSKTLRFVIFRIPYDGQSPETQQF